MPDHINTITDFEKVIDAIYGVYLDSTAGFTRLRKDFEKTQLDILESLKNSNPELATMEYLDQKAMVYGKGDPNPPDAIELHRTTQREYKQRNSENGSNFLFIGSMALVSIYQFWEDHYRAKIAKLFNIPKNKSIEPIMGDIRVLRRSIIHHAGIALADVESCEILTWFHEGDAIFLRQREV